MSEDVKQEPLAKGMVRIFFSRAEIMGYVFAKGKSVHFQQGRYTTSNPEEIEELEKECLAGHPNFYMDDNVKVIEAASLDPMHQLREQIRKEEIEKIRAATNPLRDMGTTEQPQGALKGIATTANISGLAAASEAQSAAAKGFAGPISVAPTAVAKKI